MQRLVLVSLAAVAATLAAPAVLAGQGASSATAAGQDLRSSTPRNLAQHPGYVVAGIDRTGKKLQASAD